MVTAPGYELFITNFTLDSDSCARDSVWNLDEAKRLDIKMTPLSASVPVPLTFLDRPSSTTTRTTTTVKNRPGALYYPDQDLRSAVKASTKSTSTRTSTIKPSKIKLINAKSRGNSRIPANTIRVLDTQRNPLGGVTRNTPSQPRRRRRRRPGNRRKSSQSKFQLSPLTAIDTRIALIEKPEDNYEYEEAGYEEYYEYDYYDEDENGIEHEIERC